MRLVLVFTATFLQSLFNLFNVQNLCLRRKQGQRGLQQDSEYELLPSSSCEKEREEEIERGIYESHLPVQNLSTPTNSSHHSKSKQSVSHIPKIMKKDAPSYPHDGYIKLSEESTMEKSSDDGVTNVEVQESIEDITKSLFRSISENQNSKLHHLIPEAYSPHYNFRRQRTYNVPAAKTKRFANSFFVKCAAETNSSLR